MNYYESQYQKLLLDAGDALSTLKLYPKSLPDIPKWDTAVGEAFLTLEELRKVVGTKFPSFTYLIDSFAVGVKTEFLRGLNAVEKLEPETARRSAARLLPVLNETEDGKILALSAKPLIDLHALKATNKLTGGSGFAHWDSLESAAKRAALSAARLVKEVEKELPGSVPAVESHFKAVGMEIEQGFAQFVERWEKKGIPGVSTIARASSSRLLDATEAAAGPL